MQTHYTNSKGQPVEIATMLRPHLANARDKLAREDRDGSRAAEIEAMTARLATLDAEYAADLAEAEGENPRIFPGANNPPAEPSPEPTATASGFDAIAVHMDDLLMEARNWADGKSAESQDHADEIDRLIDDLRLAMQTAEKARVAEKKPLDEQITEIQNRYNVYIAPSTNKKPGKVVVAIDALKAALKPFLDEQKRQRDAEAEDARKAAQDAADAAAAALRSTEASDLEAREAAEVLVEAATDAAQVAKRAEKAATIGTGLTRFYEPVLTDQREAVLHYMKQQPQAFLTLCMDLAKADVRAGKRQIPGFEVRELTRVVG